MSTEVKSKWTCEPLSSRRQKKRYLIWTISFGHFLFLKLKMGWTENADHLFTYYLLSFVWSCSIIGRAFARAPITTCDSFYSIIILIQINECVYEWLLNFFPSMWTVHVGLRTFFHLSTRDRCCPRGARATSSKVHFHFGACTEIIHNRFP